VSARNTADVRAQLDVVSRQLDEADAGTEDVSLIERTYAVGVRDALRWSLGDTPTF
jgi:hypothetical protein